MAKNRVDVDVEVDDKGSLKQVTKDSKKAKKGLDGVAKASRTADRNLKGAAKASSNSTKNFSKMAQGTGGLVAVYATLAAQVFAVSAAFEFLKGASQLKNLIAGQEALGAVTGVAYKTITNSIQEATAGQLKYADAAKAAAIGTASGLSPDQLARLGEAAKKTSVALGRDLGDSFDRLIRGVTKAEPELLDELGIILRLENATRKYGLSIGKSAKELNEFERSQAVANEVLSQAEEKFGKLKVDENAVALNNFAKAFDDVINNLRDMLAGPVASIASFLSENILALIGVLSLFATTVAKQILPSMADWRKSSLAAMDAQKIRLKDLNKVLDKTRLNYDKLTKTQAQALKDSTKVSKQLLGTGASKTGRGASDFLTGASLNTKDAKIAQRAASRALKQAEEQLKTSAKVRTGILKDMNAKQVADLRRSYGIRAGIIKDFEKTAKISGDRIAANWNIAMARMSVSTTKFKASLSSLGSKLAVVGSALGSVLFWVSLAVIAWDLLVAGFEKFNPESAKMASLNAETSKLVDTYSTLNEELDAAAATRSDTGALTALENTVSLGNSIASLNIPNLIKDINALDPRADKYEELKEELLETAMAAERIDSGFIGLSKSIKDGTTITVPAAQKYRALSSEMQGLRVQIEQLPALANETDQALSRLIGTMSKPFGSVLLDSAVAEAIATQAGLQVVLAEITEDRAALAALEKPTIRDARYRYDKIVEGNLVRGTKISDEQVVPKTEDQQVEIAALSEIIDKNKTILDILKLRLVFVKALATATEANADKFRAATQKEAFWRLKASELQSKGASFQQRNLNISAEEIKNQSKVFKLQTKVIAAQQNLTALRASAQKAQDDPSMNADIRASELQKRDTAVVLLEAAHNNLAVAENERDTQTTINVEKLRGVELDRAALDISYERLAAELETAEVSKNRKLISSGATGFGVEKDQDLTKNQERLLNAKATEADIDVSTAKSKLHWTDKVNQQAILDAERGVQQAEARQALANQEIAIFKQRGEILRNSIKDETQQLQLRLQNHSINPAVTAFNEKMLEFKRMNIDLTEKQQQLLYEELDLQERLRQDFQLQAVVFGSMELNIAGAFDAIVTGTKSVKDAFADMATNILKDISAMITRMLVLRAISSMFGPGILGGSTAASSASTGLSSAASSGNFSGTLDTSSITQGLRYGGIAEQMNGFSSGGVSKGSDAGYPVTLHGTEAVVPLPNGKSIPVDVNGAGQQNNVSVNVNIDSNGNATQSSQADGAGGANLGNAIAKAVQQELQNQKRSGGILNPYGVA